MLDFLIEYGPWGMLVASFIAGSVFPFSSEAVMLAMLAAGVDPWEMVIFASIGNVAGSMFNYGVGRMGRLDWIEKYLHVKKESLDKAQRFMGGRGAWMGFFTFLPILGSAISILLGLMRANMFITLISITLGKVMRYMILAWPFI
ncbi:MAG: DedA family protein [Prevotellaceae bacterium]|nr:DedA family protein [Prevotellaceae bacterium]MDO4991394.1 DedA family protein [Prevotellaceae bacterium]